MHKILIACALAALAATGCASAQNDQNGPNTGVRAQMQQARADAGTASLAALSADHRAKVQSIVDAFDAGTIDAQAAASQIDAVLTPDEAKAVLAQQQKMRDAMRAAFAANGGATGGGMRHGGMHGGGNHTPDAGRALLMLTASPDKLRDAMRGNAAGAQPPQ